MPSPTKRHATARAMPAPTQAQQPYPVQMLHSAAATILQRGQERDTSADGQAQERSMAATSSRWSARDAVLM